MHEKESSYLEAYRELKAKKDALTDLTGKIRKVAASLEKWEHTAAEMGNLYFEDNKPEWREETLRSFHNLRSLLIEYRTMAQALLKQWSKLPAENRVGLNEPGTLSA